MSLGFQNAGFDVVAAFDNWEPAVNIYRKNFTHPIYKADLNEDAPVDQIERLQPDIIIGGPPCQDFSIAGYRNMGERANLTIRYAEIISKLKPKWFVMENVYNIERMPVLPKATSLGRTRMTTRGVPQARMRFFMVGHLGDKDDFLGELLDGRQSENPMTVYDYLGDSLHTEYYYMHPRSYNRRAVFSIHEPSATIRGVNRPIPDGYKRHHADKADISDGVRALTSKERSYIQTFPESFVFEGKKTDVEQAIGNAVPVKLAEYVAKCILDYEQKEGAPSI
jgi:DNA (cytosine-5)-methyltransferase 1